MFDIFFIQHAKENFDGKTLRGSQGQNNSIVIRASLQLKIKLPTKAFSQGEPPTTIGTRAVGGMDHKMHATDFIKKTLKDNLLLGGYEPKGGLLYTYIIDSLENGPLVFHSRHFG